MLNLFNFMSDLFELFSTLLLYYPCFQAFTLVIITGCVADIIFKLMGRR